MSHVTDAIRAMLLRKALDGDEQALEDLCNERLRDVDDLLDQDVEDNVIILGA